MGNGTQSVVFMVLLGVVLTGGHLGLPLVVGSICLVIFAAYLYGSGMLTEFAAVWSS